MTPEEFAVAIKLAAEAASYEEAVSALTKQGMPESFARHHAGIMWGDVDNEPEHENEP